MSVQAVHAVRSVKGFSRPVKCASLTMDFGAQCVSSSLTQVPRETLTQMACHYTQVLTSEARHEGSGRMLTSGAEQRAKAPRPRRRRGPPTPAGRPGRRPQPNRRLLHCPLQPLQHQQCGVNWCHLHLGCQESSQPASTHMHPQASPVLDGLHIRGRRRTIGSRSGHSSESPSTPALAGPCAALRRLAVGCAFGWWLSASAFRRLLAAGADAGAAATPLASAAGATASGMMPLGRGGAVAGAASPCSSSGRNQWSAPVRRHIGMASCRRPRFESHKVTIETPRESSRWPCHGGCAAGWAARRAAHSTKRRPSRPGCRTGCTPSAPARSAR